MDLAGLARAFLDAVGGWFKWTNKKTELNNDPKIQANVQEAKMQADRDETRRLIELAQKGDKNAIAELQKRS